MFLGYCGADIKALCTEAGLSALRHQFPQIYASKEKLQLDLSRIKVSARDFQHAMQTIVPAAQRAVVSPGRSLSFVVKPLLQNQFVSALEVVKKLIPEVLYSTSKLEGPGKFFVVILSSLIYLDTDLWGILLLKSMQSYWKHVSPSCTICGFMHEEFK